MSGEQYFKYIHDKKELTNNKSKRKICADGLIATS